MELILIGFASTILMIMSIWTIKRFMIKSSNEAIQKIFEENLKQQMDLDFEKSLKNVAPEIVENMTNKYVENMDRKIDERELKWQLSSNEQKKELEKMVEKLNQRDLRSEMMLKAQKQELEKMVEKLYQRDKLFEQNQKNKMENSEKNFSEITKNSEKIISDFTKDIFENISSLDKRLKNFESFERENKALMLSGQENIKNLAYKFSSVLESSTDIGAWGEMHLNKVLEISGMLKHVDFEEQKSIDNQNSMKPDVIIHLPGTNKKIVIDSKVPMSNYNRASEEQDSKQRDEYMSAFVKDTKDRVRELSSKNYHKQFPNSPELVICFFPSESILVDSNKYDKTLMEYAANKNILLASPSNLIALLKTVAIAWRDEELSLNAKEIGFIGGELYERLLVFSEHLGKIGKNLGTLNGTYKKAVGSFEKRIIPGAHKIKKITAKDSMDEIDSKIMELDDYPVDLTNILAEKNEIAEKSLGENS